MDQPTTVKPHEYDKLMPFLEKSYKLPKDFFQTNYPHRWPRDMIECDLTYIIKQHQRIASHVRVFPLPLVIADNTVIDSGGIGGVATLQKYRGRGMMSRLLKHVIQEMTAQGLALSVLWGARDRYGHFGWEVTGQQVVFNLDQGTLAKLKHLPKVRLRQYKGEPADLQKVIRLHRQNPLRVKRSTLQYYRIFKKQNLKIWLGTQGKKQAYIIISDDKDIPECGGDGMVFMAMARSLVKAKGLQVALPYYPTSILKACAETAEVWKTIPFVQARILDLKKLIGLFLNQINAKWKKLKTTKSYYLTLAIKETGQKVTLQLGKQVRLTNQTRSDRTIRLGERAMVRLLFSPQVQPDGLLSLIFPLDFYIWNLDYI